MPEDVIRKMGYLCLGSRLKRIGERLQADTQRFIERSGLEIQPSQYTLLAALDCNGPLMIGELVEALGVSQPGVTRNVIRLVEMGLVDINRVGSDQRQKTVELTAAGRQMIAHSKREIWPHIEAAVTELCDGLSGPLLAQLAAIEDGLAEKPLDQRAANRNARASPRKTTVHARRAGAAR